MKTTIKVAVVLIFALGLTSCNDDNNYDEIQDISRVPIDSVKFVNDTMQVYSTQSIITYSNYTTGCEGFYGHKYEKEDLTRLVSTYKFKTNGTCETSVARGTKINFQPEQKGIYTFKFWQGKDASDSDIWLEKKVVVE